MIQRTFATTTLLKFMLIVALSSLPSSVRSNDWKNVDIRGLGFVTGMIIHPLSLDKYVRTDVGGVLRLTSTGWVGITDKIIKQSTGVSPDVETFAIDPNNPNIIYALTGHNLNTDDKTFFLKTTNKGSSWSILPINKTTIAAGGNSNYRNIGEKMAVDPSNSRRIFLGTRVNGLWISEDAGSTWNRVTSFPTNGTNGGQNDPGGLSFVIFDNSTKTSAGNSAIIYVGVFGDGSGGAIYRSVDGGITWCLVSGTDIPAKGPARAVLRNGTGLYVAYTSDSYNGAVLFITSNNPSICSATTVSDKTPPSDCPFFGTYSWGAIAVNPKNPNQVVIAPFQVSPRKIFFTRNFLSASPTWNISTSDSISGYTSCLSVSRTHNYTVPSWYGSFEYDWVGNLVMNPNNVNEMWLTTGYGVLRMTNFFTSGSKTFDYLNSMKGLEELCVMDIIVPPKSSDFPYELCSVHQDAFGFCHESIASPPLRKIQDLGIIIGHDITYGSFASNTVIIATAIQGGNPGNVAAKISRNGGRNWSDLPQYFVGCQGSVAGNIAINSGDPQNFVWAAQSRVYAPCSNWNQVVMNPQYTTDGGVTWTPCQGISFNTPNFPLQLEYWNGQVLAADFVTPNVFYYYVQLQEWPWSSSFYRSTDKGATWTQTCTNCLPTWDIQPYIKSNPYRSGDIWAAFPSVAGLYRSVNGGDTWVKISPNSKIYAVAIGPPLSQGKNETIFVRAIIPNLGEGVFWSDNFGATWRHVTTAYNVPLGIAGAFEADRNVPGRVFIGSGCRGIFYAQVQPPPTPSPTPTS